MIVDDDVNGSESSADESLDDNPSGEGESSSKSEERYKDLLKKKDAAIAKLRSERDEARASLESKTEDIEDRIDDLESKKRLSASEEEELENLQDYIAKVKRDKRGKIWTANIIPDISKEVSRDEVARLDLAYAEIEVEKLCDEENKNLPEKDQISLDAFYTKIKKYMRKVDPAAEMKLVRRTQQAYKLMKQEERFAKREKELLEKEEKFKDDGGSQQPRAQSREEILNWRDSKNPDAALSGLLKGISAVQESSRPS